MKFGLQTYRNSGNLGDEIQSIAARRFLPRVDVLIDRDLPEDTLGKGSEPVAVIMNGWYSARPEGWPPPPRILPLLISMHITQQPGKLGINAKDYFTGDIREYLRRWGPVGARDLATLEWLQRHEIPCHFSGCLTLTLECRERQTRERHIACVDVPDEVVTLIRRRTKRPVLVLSHIDHSGGAEERLQMAEQLLSIYERAHCVITSRLHCALPCLGFETPVLMIDLAEDRYRFEGLDTLYRHCNLKSFFNGTYEFDLESPNPNDLDYLKFKNSLAERSKDFVQNAERLVGARPFGAEETLRMRFNTLWVQYDKLRQQCDKLRQRADTAQRDKEQIVSALKETRRDLTDLQKKINSSRYIFRAAWKKVGNAPRNWSKKIRKHRQKKTDFTPNSKLGG